MQRSSWQMLQSNLVWQAGHPLIQQIQSHINVTRKESAGRLLSPCHYHRGWGSAGEVAEVREKFKVQLPWSKTPRRVHRRWGIVQREQLRAPGSHSRSQSPGTPSSCSAGSSLRLWRGSMVSWSTRTWTGQSVYTAKKSLFFQQYLRKLDTYPFFKGPTLADFMLVVVEQFLSSLYHLVAHILYLGHSLHKDTNKAHGQFSQVSITTAFDNPTSWQNS